MEIPEPPQEIIYPEKPVPAKSTNVISRSFISMALFVAAFYYFFHYDLKYIFILFGVILIHELGHFITMRIFNYKDTSIFFIPFLGAVAIGEKENVSQLQRTVILFAGPLPGILIGSVLYYVGNTTLNFEMIRIANVFLFINLFNLVPVYPLDGGQLLHNLFFKTGNIITIVFLVVSMILFTWFAITQEAYALLLIPFALLMQLTNTRTISSLQKKLTAEGFDLNKSFDALSDREYWTIRDHLAGLNYYGRYIQEGNYTVSPRENSIISYIKQVLLQRPLIGDMGATAKALTVLIWVACFAIPFLLGLASRYVEVIMD